nr:pyridoxamine 5'-phosphate oxidase family protein [Streptomyces atratus]
MATNTAVELDELPAFVRPGHRAIPLTTRSEGRPRGSPPTCGADDAGRTVVPAYPERARTRNAKRDERVGVIVLSDEIEQGQRVALRRGAAAGRRVGTGEGAGGISAVPPPLSGPASPRCPRSAGPGRR